MLKEAGTCRLLVTPGLVTAGWGEPAWRIKEQHYFTDGQIPEYLFAYFQSQRVWESMREQCRGLAGRRIRLRESAFLAHELWLPPVSYQQKVKTAFESLKSAATLQRDVPAELEALQSSLLDQAFSGNL